MVSVGQVWKFRDSEVYFIVTKVYTSMICFAFLQDSESTGWSIAGQFENNYVYVSG